MRIKDILISFLLLTNIFIMIYIQIKIANINNYIIDEIIKLEKEDKILYKELEYLDIEMIKRDSNIINMLESLNILEDK